ncbi:putative Serine/threonine-protein kinase [Echria macrotheca]|uniref:Serine/threonine-protein kinase n=1 Tax=Echria macrotheca TaxID=438768 RepID=A0AAJ0F3T4_9PEZI|nr:putative Serine/threonine-protein kinase [Echria macrotheca]
MSPNSETGVPTTLDLASQLQTRENDPNLPTAAVAVTTTVEIPLIVHTDAPDTNAISEENIERLEHLSSPGVGQDRICTPKKSFVPQNECTNESPSSHSSFLPTPTTNGTRHSRSPDYTSVGHRESPNTSTSALRESDDESSFFSATSSVMSSDLESGLPSPENLTFGAVGAEAEPRRDVFDESHDELVDHTSPRSYNSPSHHQDTLSNNRATRAAFTRHESTLPTIHRGKSKPRLVEEQSEITDFGEILHYQDRETRGRRTGRSKPSVGRSLRLQDKLFKVLEPIDDINKEKGFFPLDLLPVLLTEQTVSKELKKHLSLVCRPDEIADYAHTICSEKRISGFEDGGKPKIRTFRKIFATLVLIEKTEAILMFIKQNISDSDLPLVRSQQGPGLETSREPIRRFKCFREKHGWSQLHIRNFEDWQWTTLAPFFAKSDERKKVPHYLLQRRVILPFRSAIKQDEVGLEGGGGRVFKAEIHPDHHNFHDFFRCPRALASDECEDAADCICLFAIKCLHSQDKESFRKEVDMLKRFSNNAHPHLISLLATYEQNRSFFLIFPRAESDLQAYWKDKEPPSPSDMDGMRWIAEQCLGIAKGVLKIHSHDSSNSRLQLPDANGLVGNHGDIKPENVLWFRERDAQGRSGRGILKLSDFGLADFNTRRTASRRFHSNIFVTCNYRAPECDLPNQGGKGRQYDIWTLGCLYLEFVVWMIGGSPLLRKFEKARLSRDKGWYNIHTDTFFELVGDDESRPQNAVIKPSVTEFIQMLRSHERSTPFILDFLTLIENGLLVVKSQTPHRFNIQQAHAELHKIFEKCQSDPGYLQAQGHNTPS